MFLILTSPNPQKKIRPLPDGSLPQDSNPPRPAPATPVVNAGGLSTSVSTPRRTSVATNGILPHTNGTGQSSIRTPNPNQHPINAKNGKVRKERDELPNQGAGRVVESVSTPMGSLAGVAGMAGGAQRPPKKRKVVSLIYLHPVTSSYLTLALAGPTAPTNATTNACRNDIASLFSV